MFNVKYNKFNKLLILINIILIIINGYIDNYLPMALSFFTVIFLMSTTTDPSLNKKIIKIRNIFEILTILFILTVIIHIALKITKNYQLEAQETIVQTESLLNNPYNIKVEPYETHLNNIASTLEMLVKEHENNNTKEYLHYEYNCDSDYELNNIKNLCQKSYKTYSDKHWSEY